MKTTFLRTTTLLCAGAALLIGAASLRADDDTKTTHRRHHREAAEKTTTGSHQIPTRDDRNSQETKGERVGGANGPEYRVRTGSTLPEHYHRRGYSTDSRDNEFIYDQNDIRLQSKNNVGDSLRNVPGVSVRGLR